LSQKNEYEENEEKQGDDEEIAEPDARRKRAEHEKQKRGRETGLDKDGESLSGRLRGLESTTNERKQMKTAILRYRSQTQKNDEGAVADEGALPPFADARLSTKF
jgi:hypothetical protein